jgi:hypothetical protein
MTKASNTNLSLRKNFIASKTRALQEVREYLKNNPTTSDAEIQGLIRSCKDQRDAILQSLRSPQKDLVGIVNELRQVRDARTGIITIITKDKDHPIELRDARGCKKPYERGYEASEMAMLNAVSAALDKLDILGLQSKNTKSQLRQVAIDFIEENNDKAGEPLNKKQRKEAGERLKKKIKSVAEILAQNGVDNPFEVLNIGKDYQNFNYDQADIVTISKIVVARDGVLKKSAERSGGIITKTVIELEVGLRGLTDEQRAQYQAIKNANGNRDDNNLPSWFTAINENERQFVEKYIDKILTGKHVHPTQLRRIAGLKNAFEKTTLIADENGQNIKQLHSSLHAGTIGSANKDSDEAQEIANNNVKQAQAYLGDGQILHCNTFNTKYPIYPVKKSAIEDTKFVNQTKKAADGNDASHTSTSFNFFRRLFGASIYSGAESSLKMIAEGVDFAQDKKLEKAVKSYLEPKGFFGRAFRRIRYGSQEKLLGNIAISDDIGLESKDLLTASLKLSRSIEIARSAVIDLSNSNLDVNQNLNFVAYRLEKSTNTELAIDVFDEEKTQEELKRFNGFKWAKLKIEKILNMCASGKDRAGLAEHNQTSQAVSNDIMQEDLDIDPKLLLAQVDGQMLAAGHTANMAGDPIAGGGSIGAYGTKSENRAGIPNDRRKTLEAIIEPESKFNSIKASKISRSKITYTATRANIEQNGYGQLIEEQVENAASVPSAHPAIDHLHHDYGFHPDHHFHPISAYLATEITQLFNNEAKKFSVDIDSEHFLASKDTTHQKMLNIFDKKLKAQEGNANPAELHKGIGLSMSLDHCDNYGQCLKIYHVKSPKFERFSSKGLPIEAKDLEGKFIVDVMVEKDGTKITININDFVNKSKSTKDALDQIAAYFHGDNKISFMANDGEIYNCSKKAIFFGENCEEFNRHGNGNGQKYDPEKHGLPNYIKSELEVLSLNTIPISR